jgi:hypothetical protein
LESEVLPLKSSLEVRLEVEGQLAGKTVPVVLDVAHPLTRVSAACFSQALPALSGTRRSQDAAGGEATWPLLRLEGLRLGPVELPAWEVGLSNERGCRVVLGADVLAAYALTVEPLRREVAFSASRPRADYERLEAEPWEEVRVLDLKRDTASGWLLLSVGVRQEGAALTGTFALDTSEPFSWVSLAPAQAAGLTPLAGERSRSAAILADEAELAEGLAVEPVFFEAGTGWGMPHVAGRLSMDVWGRFHVTVDARAGVLVLRRPRVQGVGERAQCLQRGAAAPAEQHCFAVHLRRLEDSLLVTAAVYRDLPGGGRLLLEPVDAQGQRLEGACRVGFSFTPTSRGMTLQHPFPWPGLSEEMPECAEGLREAKGYALSFFEEGLSRGCPATCAFSIHPATSRTVCKCQRTPFGDYLITTPERLQSPSGE